MRDRRHHLPTVVTAVASAPGIHLMGALGNTIAAETRAGVVQVDTGGGRKLPQRLTSAHRRATEPGP